MTDFEFWGHLRRALSAEFLHVFESTRIPDGVNEAVVVGPETEAEIQTLQNEDENADFSFHVTVVSTIGWQSAMALAPRAHTCVEDLEKLPGVTFVGLDRASFMLSMAEGARPLFAKALHYRASTTLG